MALTATGVTYTPAANFIGTDSFTYTISDGNGGTATATVSVTVTPVNDNPIANRTPATVAEDSAATAVDVLANDTLGPDSGETLTVTAVTQGEHGTVTLVGGVVRYTPTANFFGPDSFTYTIGDGNGGTATAHGQRDGDSRQRQPGREPGCGDGAGGQRGNGDRRAGQRLAGRRQRRDADGDGGHAGQRGRHRDVHGDRRELHAGGELLRHRQLHLHDQRRQRRDRDGDGHRDGDHGQRQPDREQRPP